MINKGGVDDDPTKIERIVNWSTPRTAYDLSSFLGLASYYRRFIPDFAKMSAPLHALAGQKPKEKWEKNLRKRSLEWSQDAKEAFNSLKEHLSTTPLLAYSDFSRGFVLEVDSSLKGLGACLLQYDESGKLHPIAYASCGLRRAQKNYTDLSSFKLELLAWKWAVTDKFEQYLLGSECIVYTYNNPLTRLQTANLGATEQR